MMEEQLISFETAKLAKEKGFNEKVLNHYEDSFDGINIFQDEVCNNDIEFYEYSAPTQSLLQKWLRENYNIHIWVCKPVGSLEYNLQTMQACDLNFYGLATINKKGYKTYEEALEIGLQKALKLII